MTKGIDTDIVLLDEALLDDPVDCQLIDHNVIVCPDPAHWTGRLRCGHSVTICDRHHVRALNRLTIRCACTKLTRGSTVTWRSL